MVVPKPETLKKYGLTADEWLAILQRQGGCCAVCGGVPSTGRFVTDHHHVRGWKKMPPERRKAYVRGILCWWCNDRIVGRGVTVAKLRAAVAYLEAFVERCAAGEAG